MNIYIYIYIYNYIQVEVIDAWHQNEKHREIHFRMNDSCLFVVYLLFQRGLGQHGYDQNNLTSMWDISMGS